MTALPETPEYGTDAWQEWRKNGLGASDMAAVLGADPWRGEYALALDKKGMSERKPQTRAMGWGHRMEQVGAEEYEALTGRVLLPGGTGWDERWPHVYSSPDRRIKDDPTGLVELKWTNKWDEPPRHVVIQCQVQMATTGAQWVDVFRMGPYGEPQPFTIARDETAEALCDLGEQWYVRYVLGDELPAVDASEAASRYLDTLVGPAEFIADVDQTALALSLRAVRKSQKAMDAEEARLVNALKESMAGGGVLTGQGFRVTWKPRKGSTRTAWDSVAAAYRSLLGTTVPADELDAIKGLHTGTSAGSVPFVVRFEEEETA